MALFFRVRRGAALRSLLIVCSAALLLLAVPTGVAAKSKGPSAKKAKKSIKSMFDAVYRESWMDGDDLTIEFKTFKFLGSKKRKMDSGYYAKPIKVWPLKSNVLVTIDRGTWGIDKTKRGWWHTDYPGGHEVFYFYRDVENSWTWATGGP